MENYEFLDALTGDVVIQDNTTGETYVERSDGKPASIESIFFPGCSMINYAMPLVAAVYDTLKQHGEVQGISLLCCGKILSYEPDGENVRTSFEGQLRDHVASVGVKRMVCACPNCVRALRCAFAEDERTKDVEVAILPKVLSGLGYRLDRATVARLVKGDEDADVLLCTHDSCPDRECGEFADGLRALVGEGLWVDPEHCRRNSICCGSLPRAAGKIAAADKCADICGREAIEKDADAIVVACMSCAFQLNMAQPHIQCVHVLELLYNWRVDWATVGAWMKLRFLFDETLGAIERDGSGRTFEGLGSKGAITPSDVEAAKDVTITNENVEEMGL